MRACVCKNGSLNGRKITYERRNLEEAAVKIGSVAGGSLEIQTGDKWESTSSTTFEIAFDLLIKVPNLTCV